MPMNKERLKKISQSFKESTGSGYDEEADRKRRMQTQSAEDVDISSKEDTGFKRTDKEDADLPEDAPLKDKVTTSILKMLKKRGPPPARK